MGQFTSFVVFASMRTGSNLLEAGLNQYDDLRCHGELFNPFFIGEEGTERYLGINMEQRDRRPERLLQAIRAKPGLPGFRMFPKHDLRVRAQVIEDPTCAKIVLRRQPLESYLSVKAARETGQWRVGREKTRKITRITFEPDEFETYCADHEQFYADLERKIRLAGQSYFPIRYEECKDVAVLNGLAAYLGASQDLKSLKEPTKRQNPSSFRDRIENYDVFSEYLSRSGYIAEREILTPDARPYLRAMRFLATDKMLYASLPGANDAHIRNWILEARKLKNPAAMQDWVQDADRPICFTFVQHPLERAYAGFMRHIFHVTDAGFPYIRQDLQTKYGLALPETAEGPMPGYDMAAHRKAFGGYLDFLKLNLSGQTPIRNDPVWVRQADLVDALRPHMPLTIILSDGHFSEDAAYLGGLAGLTGQPAGPVEPDPRFPLREIRTPEIEAKIRDLYSQDFRRFGFSGSL